MKMTNTNKVNGELAVRSLSDKAREYYDGTSPSLERREYEYEYEEKEHIFDQDSAGDI